MQRVEWTDRIGRRVKLRDLHILLAVAQSGSMARAADRLAISHPVVSKTITELERALGVKLLDRTAQGVELNDYGRAFIKCGTAVFDELRRGVQEIELISDPTVGEVRVGSTGPLTDGLVPDVVARLATRHPGIEVHAVEGDGPTLCQMLRKRNLDFAVSRQWGSSLGDDFSGEYLFDESMFVIAGLKNPWSSRRRINFADLLGEPWVLPELDNPVGALIVEGFRRCGTALPKPRVVSNSMAVRTRLVESDRFLTLLPGSMLHFGNNRLRVKKLPVVLPLESQPVEIIVLKNRTLNAVAKLFVQELREVVRPLLKDRRPSYERSR
jgi:DNA-binding transcriptional LysR family regulator